jgi:hypothetical protein
MPLTIQDIPEELLLLILALLTITDRVVASAVCRIWHRLCRDGALHQVGAAPADGTPPCLLASTLVRSAGVVCAHGKSALSNYPDARTSMSFRHRLEWAPVSPSLTSLDLFGTPSGAWMTRLLRLVAAGSPRLVHLGITLRGLPTSTRGVLEFAGVFSELTSLRSLNVSERWRGDLVGIPFVTLVGKLPPTLRALRCTGIAGKTVDVLYAEVGVTVSSRACLGRLTTLAIREEHGVTELDITTALKACTSLTSLQLDSLNTQTRDRDKTLRLVHVLCEDVPRLPLRHLSLRANMIKESELRTLVRVFSATLEMLDVSFGSMHAASCATAPWDALERPVSDADGRPYDAMAETLMTRIKTTVSGDTHWAHAKRWPIQVIWMRDVYNILTATATENRPLRHLRVTTPLVVELDGTRADGRHPSATFSKWDSPVFQERVRERTQEWDDTVATDLAPQWSARDIIDTRTRDRCPRASVWRTATFVRNRTVTTPAVTVAVAATTAEAVGGAEGKSA